MKLKTVRVSDFRSVRDACSFEASDITCLIGKNESGKTTILDALYKLNPVIPEHGAFDVDEDYPRVDVEDYRLRVARGEWQPATVIKATFGLEPDDLKELEADFPGLLAEPQLVLSKGYSNKVVVELQASEESALECLLRAAVEAVSRPRNIARCSTFEDLVEALKPFETEEAAQKVLALATGVMDEGLVAFLYGHYLEKRVPKFLYFDEFYQMEGHVNVDALLERRRTNKLLDSDHPLLGLISLARMDLEEICNPKRALQRDNRLEGASNHLTRTVMKYWSQNRSLELRFDIRPALPNDPPDMRTGVNLWGHVYNSKQRITTLLGRRSRGFVWFYSFVAWFSQHSLSGSPLIVLLDEPAVHLHGTAQRDLLLYLEDECAGGLQVLYTTQSPYLIDARRLDRVRIVEDRTVEDPEFIFASPKRQGTQVYREVTEASADSKLPLLSALGHKLLEGFSPGPAVLLVERVCDLLYLQTMSSLLPQGGLDPRWRITPVDGAGRIAIFEGLAGRNDGRIVAGVFSLGADDTPDASSSMVTESLHKERFLCYERFCHLAAADVEDLFEPEFYLDLVNAEYQEALERPLSRSQLKPRKLKIAERIAVYTRAHPMAGGAVFNRERPAMRFAENVTALGDKLSADTLSRFERLFATLNALLPPVQQAAPEE